MSGLGLGCVARRVLGERLGRELLHQRCRGRRLRLEQGCAWLELGLGLEVQVRVRVRVREGVGAGLGVGVGLGLGLE